MKRYVAFKSTSCRTNTAATRALATYSPVAQASPQLPGMHAGDTIPTRTCASGSGTAADRANQCVTPTPCHKTTCNAGNGEPQMRAAHVACRNSVWQHTLYFSSFAAMCVCAICIFEISYWRLFSAKRHVTGLALHSSGQCVGLGCHRAPCDGVHCSISL